MSSPIPAMLAQLKHHAREGQGLVEYGLLMILVSVAAVTILTVIGLSIVGRFQFVADQFP